MTVSRLIEIMLVARASAKNARDGRVVVVCDEVLDVLHSALYKAQEQMGNE